MGSGEDRKPLSSEDAPILIVPVFRSVMLVRNKLITLIHNLIDVVEKNTFLFLMCLFL